MGFYFYCVLFRTGQRGPNISVVVFRAFAKVTYPSDKKDQHLRITFRLQYSSALLARQTFHVLSPIPAFNAFSGAFWTDLIGSLDREDNFSSWFFLKAQMFFFLINCSLPTIYITDHLHSYIIQILKDCLLDQPGMLFSAVQV